MSIRSRRLQSWMTRLALAAILLLAAVPTVGRWMEAGRGIPAVAGMAICTSEGLARSTGTRLFQRDPIPAGTVPGEECAYCPLLASATPVVPATLLLLPLPASSPEGPLPSSPPRDAILPQGLGARGPPIIS